MKAPICGICLNSDILCMACKRKIDEGRVTENDVKISRLLHETAKNFRMLDDIEVKKVIDSKDILIIVCGKGDRPKLIGRDGSVIKKLLRTASKSIRWLRKRKI